MSTAIHDIAWYAPKAMTCKEYLEERLKISLTLYGDNSIELKLPDDTNSNLICKVWATLEEKAEYEPPDDFVRVYYGEAKNLVCQGYGHMTLGEIA